MKLPTFVLATLICELFASTGQAQLQTIKYAEDKTTELINPERGWFRTVEPDYDSNTPAPPISGDLLANWKSVDRICLVRKYYLIRKWIDAPLPQSVLDEVTADLATCREQGFKLILRFTYIHNRKFGTNDATLATTVGHIQQLGPVLQANTDVIDHMHGGFIGLWGEMHNSANRHVLPGTRTLSASGQAIIETLLTNLPPDRMIGLRYPTFKSRWRWPKPLTLTEAYTGTDQARLGAYNQGFLYDDTDFGSFAGNQLEGDKERAYWRADVDATFMSGEPAGMTHPYSEQDPTPYLAEFHFASLNMQQADADRLYQHWKDKGYHKTITRQLGYRFVLEKAEYPVEIKLGSNFTANVWLRNDGFAALHNPRDITAGLRLSGVTNVHMVKISNVDPRLWRPGASQQFQFKINVPVGTKPGKYEVLFGMPDPKPTLSGRTDYAIRCANQSIWDAATGTHLLGSVQIVGVSDPVAGGKSN